MLATTILLSGMAVKLLAVNRWGAKGLVLLALLVMIDVLVVAVAHHQH